jgi:23S rRNA (guanosine2251-2'-O)-methyltransferase
LNNLLLFSVKNKSTFWIFGKHPVKEAILKNKKNVLKIITSNQLNENFLENLKIKIDPSFLKKKFKNDAHQGIAAELKVPLDLKINYNDIEKEKKLLILDGINDIRNIGSIFRSAYAFDFKNIIINKKDYNMTDPYLYKSASGSIENLNIYNVVNVKYEIEELKKRNFKIYGLDSNNGESLVNVISKIKKNDEMFAFVFGSEHKGIRRIIKDKCDQSIKINMSPNSFSLNVSNAASVAMGIFFNLKI